MNKLCSCLIALAGLFLLSGTAARAGTFEILQMFAAMPPDASRGEVRRFYSLRAFEPAWNADDRRLALQYLSHADAEGLAAQDYQLHADGRSSAADDIALTQNVLRYARDIRIGRVVPNSVYNDVDLPQQSIDAVALLDASLKSGDLNRFLSGLPPQHAGYSFLRTVLEKYRHIEVLGGWPVLPPMKGTIADLAPAERSQVLRRLAVEDQGVDLGNSGEVALDGALRRFQARHGLDTDGKIGRLTLAALNATVADRILQIEANMERWRWLPYRLEDRYIMVNVADASLEGIDHGKVVLTSRVVVGKPKTPTPMLATTIVAVTLNPPWNVPGPIASKELLPKLRKNRDYLTRERMILRNGPPGDPHGVEINWAAVSGSHFPYEIQQLPGEKNALGLLKLEMPNPFDVYLHDTPAKGLFSENRRFFSHGCVRVQNIGALAQYALTGNPEADVARLIKNEDEKTQRLALDKSLKVYVLYWTVFRNADGSAAFRDDIYGRDRRLIDKLSGKRVAQRAASQPECSG